MKATLQGYLNAARQSLLWKLEGLSDYDLRRPLTPTGTNLLGVLKHVASVEMGYFTEVFGRPCPMDFPWFAEGAEPNADMWATADETKEWIVEMYHRSWEVSDATIAELPLDSPGYASWWPEGKREVTLHSVLVHMLAETNRHGGHVDIVRELIDGRAGHSAGGTMVPTESDRWWAEYVARVEATARTFSNERA